MVRAMTIMDIRTAIMTTMPTNMVMIKDIIRMCTLRTAVMNKMDTTTRGMTATTTIKTNIHSKGHLRQIPADVVLLRKV